jgi:argininosuccinate lyase
VKSRVTERLQEGPAPEVLEHLYVPRLQAEFAATFPYMTAANKAHVLMLSRQEIISRAAAAHILRALLAIESDGPAAFQLDPRLEDAFFNYEAAVIRLTGPDIGGQMHTARSRNDLSATLLRLRLRDGVLDFVPCLFTARRTALDQAERYADVIMPGYTHLQPAQPITFGHYLVGVAAALERDTHRLAAVYPSVNLSPLGACALAGTTFPIDRQYTSSLLGFDGLVEHTLDAVASRDCALELLAQAAIFGLTCSRVAQDMYVWFTQEFQAVDLPDRVAGTSSIMPQKKNPVVLEHLKGKPAHLLAAFLAAATAVKNVSFTNTIDGNREAMHGLWDALEEARRCALLLNLVLASVTPNAPLLLERAQSDFCTATDLADALVRSSGLSFRQAHHVVGGVVREALARGLRADQIRPELVDEVAHTVVNRAANLPEAAVQQALDARQAVQARTTIGGPAPAEVRRMVQAARQRLSAEEKTHAARRTRVVRAQRRLGTEVRALLKQAR